MSEHGDYADEMFRERFRRETPDWRLEEVDECLARHEREEPTPRLSHNTSQSLAAQDNSGNRPLSLPMCGTALDALEDEFAKQKAACDAAGSTCASRAWEFALRLLKQHRADGNRELFPAALAAKNL